MLGVIAIGGAVVAGAVGAGVTVYRRKKAKAAQRARLALLTQFTKPAAPTPVRVGGAAAQPPQAPPPGKPQPAPAQEVVFRPAVMPREVLPEGVTFRATDTPVPAAQPTQPLQTKALLPVFTPSVVRAEFFTPAVVKDTGTATPPFNPYERAAEEL